LSLYDPYVRLEQLIGKNKSFADYELPELGNLIQSALPAALIAADVVILTQATDPSLEEIKKLLRPDQIIVDLCGVLPQVKGTQTCQSLIAP